MLVETGMVPVTEPYTEVVLDAPSGIIRTKVHVVDGEAVEVSILNVPAFLYKKIWRSIHRTGAEYPTIFLLEVLFLR